MPDAVNIRHRPPRCLGKRLWYRGIVDVEINVNVVVEGHVLYILYEIPTGSSSLWIFLILSNYHLRFLEFMHTALRNNMLVVHAGPEINLGLIVLVEWQLYLRNALLLEMLFSEELFSLRNALHAMSSKEMMQRYHIPRKSRLLFLEFWTESVATIN